MKIRDIFDDTYIHTKDAKDQFKKVFTKDIKQWLGKTFFCVFPCKPERNIMICIQNYFCLMLWLKLLKIKSWIIYNVQ